MFIKHWQPFEHSPRHSYMQHWMHFCKIPVRGYILASRLQIRRWGLWELPTKWVPSMDIAASDLPLIVSLPTGFLDLGIAKYRCPRPKRASCSFPFRTFPREAWGKGLEGLAILNWWKQGTVTLGTLISSSVKWGRKQQGTPWFQ